MTSRTAHRLRAIGDALRTLAGGLLLAGGFIALCWAVGLVAIR